LAFPRVATHAGGINLLFFCHFIALAWAFRVVFARHAFVHAAVRAAVHAAHPLAIISTTIWKTLRLAAPGTAAARFTFSAVSRIHITKRGGAAVVPRFTSVIIGVFIRSVFRIVWFASDVTNSAREPRLAFLTDWRPRGIGKETLSTGFTHRLTLLILIFA
jgi:hypothetical protein